jgi:hypothetical protein
MKFRISFIFLIVISIITRYSTATAQGTAFTYQGRLNANGGPASGTYSLVFSLYATNTGGTAVAGPVTNNGVAVTNGLFMVTIDFGSGAWNGETNWLQIGVETNGSSPFTSLAPRQELTPTPYAIYSTTAGGLPALVIQDGDDNGAPDLIGGSSLNYVPAGVVGATIGGGGATNFLNVAYSNSVTGDFGVVGGGSGNLAGNAFYATVGGGNENTASGGDASVLGGAFNQAVANYSTVVGGYGNYADGVGSFIGGGGYDTSVFEGNGATGNASTIAGGVNNEAQNAYATISGGRNHLASGYASTIAGGDGNSATLDDTFVGGGWGNSAQNYDSAIVGGDNNQAAGYASAISGGEYNNTYGDDSAVGGGLGNTVGSSDDVVSGGFENHHKLRHRRRRY